ncbi:CD177 antigen isoform X1 [Saccopteryx bilineata]|uniref:CD177 antigen isoform X1 n=2 Tax=Saccopteryx bilineata TaxID=59482 RepID=UPI00338DC494
MIPALLTAVLGLTLQVPWVQALTCEWGTLKSVKSTTELPFHWTAGREVCRDGQGCQDTLMLIENGPQVLLVINKGCTQRKDQESQVTVHRAGPGLSVVSYTHVCRHNDFCNNVSSTLPLWTMPTTAAPGSVRCPVCFTTEGCKSAPEMTCPVGNTHCYNGVLQLREGNTNSTVRVQGCMPQATCNLLNETREIGHLSVRESCDTNEVQALTCEWGSLETVRNTSELPLQWTNGKEVCGDGQGCQDTLMLIENGPQVFLVLSKGCTQREDQETQVTVHRAGPGLSVISYTRVCRHKDLCNDLSGTLPLWTLPTTAAPGSVRCPVCFTTEGCESAPEMTCPAGHTHCYNGVLQLRGRNINTDLRVQGCMPQATCNLLNETRKIGHLSVRESCGVQALTCEWGSLKTVRDTSELPLQWTAGKEVCGDGQGCQDTLMLIENGPQVLLVLSKGCTQRENQESQVTVHRAGPGLSVVSYTHVCRHNDFCNDLSSTLPLWTLPTTAAPGSVRCPVCFTTEGCESAPEMTCPVGNTHCYNGVLQLRGGNINTDLRVQGCMPQATCNLLNETQEIGHVSVRESCDGKATRTCQRGVMLQLKQNLSREPVQWDTPRKVTCGLDEVCQETLLLIDTGTRSLIVGSKGCSKSKKQNSQTVSIHSRPPGLLIASYAHFCSSNGCNRAQSSSVLLNSLPRSAAPVPGDLHCPSCVQLGHSCSSSENVICPKGTTHCYKGQISLSGGGFSSALAIQGCMVPASSSLLNHTNNIGEFVAVEFPEGENNRIIARAASAPYLAWEVGLGISLAFWYGTTSLLADFISP